MLLLEVVAAMMAVSAVVPAVLFALNLRRYRLPKFGAEYKAPVAVLIPARDEEKNIRACLESVLASREVDLEVFVLDDDSADRTVNIVLDVAGRDSRVKLLQSSRLPSGWTGKQYACWQLASATETPAMLFMDADVRVKPWAIARTVAALRKKKVQLLSGFPRPVATGVFGQDAAGAAAISAARVPAFWTNAKDDPPGVCGRQRTVHAGGSRGLLRDRWP